jgi:DNA-binding response OmpR family regulator
MPASRHSSARLARERFLLLLIRNQRVSDKLPKDCAILIVEDDLAIRRLVKLVLEREGYQVEVASDGIEAVLKLGVLDYDVIILDLMMPNLDGFSFINTMAEHDPERLKHIIVTSAASPGLIEERMKGTPFLVMPKPFDIQELIANVRACIEAL